MSTLALERPALAADDEEAEEDGDDRQIIDLDGINGKKLAVLLLSLAHSFVPTPPLPPYVAPPVSAVRSFGRMHARNSNVRDTTWPICATLQAACLFPLHLILRLGEGRWCWEPSW